MNIYVRIWISKVICICLSIIHHPAGQTTHPKTSNRNYGTTLSGKTNKILFSILGELRGRAPYRCPQILDKSFTCRGVDGVSLLAYIRELSGLERWALESALICGSVMMDAKKEGDWKNWIYYALDFDKIGALNCVHSFCPSLHKVGHVSFSLIAKEYQNHNIQSHTWISILATLCLCVCYTITCPYRSVRRCSPCPKMRAARNSQKL